MSNESESKMKGQVIVKNALELIEKSSAHFTKVSTLHQEVADKMNEMGSHLESISNLYRDAIRGITEIFIELEKNKQEAEKTGEE